jgi:molybdopterin-guanine dinucleotide biosynthesis protein A
MGTDKALLAVGGAPMARRVADALAAAGAATVVAVGGDRTGLRRLGLDVVADRWPGEGPLGGVVTALHRGSGPAVAVLACDLLRPDAATIRGLVRERDEHDADLVVPVAGGRPQWTHAVWHRRSRVVLHDRFAAGERSLAAATGGLAVRFVDLADPSTTADADAPSDLLDGATGPIA